MKTWILGTEYDFSDTKSMNRLADAISICGINSVRQIALGLQTALISASVKEIPTDRPVRYYSLNCVDNKDCQGFSVFLAYKPLTPNTPTNHLLIKDAISQGILEAIYEDDINKVVEISKEEYDRAMKA